MILRSAEASIIGAGIFLGAVGTCCVGQCCGLGQQVVA